MSVTREFANEFGLVYAKATYANYVISIFASGIQFFMIAYCLTTFFETPADLRKGRAPYLVVGCLIFVFSTLSACVDITISFDMLLEASNGIEYLGLLSPGWKDLVTSVSILMMFILGDGLLLYRCYLILYGGHRWLLALPVATYLSTIGLSLYQIALIATIEGWGGQTSALVTESSRNILSVLTTIFITVIICYRLNSDYKRLAKALPTKRLGVYTNAIRILVESALPLSIAGIAQVSVQIPQSVYGARKMAGFTGDRKALMVALSTTSLLWYALLAISPQLIIFRVSTGRSWAKTVRSTDAEAFSRSLAFNHAPCAAESSISGNEESEEEGRGNSKEPQNFPSAS
ncbi:hypothetical protein FA15DRAFT_758593 [Coprinopsis marcescibilis]|uniref:Fungal pheromone STE3G-protein-coupled receptor n=1 Tax=Coprinopsis marcescibilis TaxID=230819 RepID=A0A5C3KNJ4_COPMA|nr:hypothetical protein FA15DRAFT_758593 [Coprinopsis marcescibilis]